MAAQLSEKAKIKLNESVKNLLGRAYVNFPPPLDRQEIVDWWHAHFDDPRIPEAYKTMESSNYQLYITRPDTKALFGAFEMQFSGQRLLAQQPGANKTPAQLGKRLIDVWPFGEDRLSELQKWMKLTATVSEEFDVAWRVTNFVIKECNTAGQINRALPELANYLPLAGREYLHNQKRASNMPYEWAAYDKNLVECASKALLKASLLKPNDRVEWTKVSENWCTFAA